ncbi:hypothetical protein N9033_00955 [bacterium]|nr:hypothetical protein [bacterium]
MTEFIDLTEMWQDHKYLQVGSYIKTSGWTPREVLEFANYFRKYLGTDQLSILSKFL